MSYESRAVSVRARGGHQELAFILLVRALVVLFALLLLSELDRHLDLQLLARPAVVAILTAMTGATLLSALRLLGRAISGYELLAQLLLDMVLMSALLWQTGGATNPFVFWFLVPVSLATLILSWPQVLLLWLGSLCAYVYLMGHYRPILPIDSPHSMLAMNSSYGWHLRGMAVDFLLSISMIAGLGSWMRALMQGSAQELAQQRELALRNEHIVALGALAAGAAHALATPINTLTLLLDEIEADARWPQGLQADGQLMRQQLELCRHLLAEVRAQAQWQSVHQHLPIARVWRDLREAMLLLHPDRHWQWPETSPDQGQWPVAVLPVLMNLLHNAALAARQRVTITCQFEARWCTLLLEDDGPGIDAALLRQLGRRPVRSDHGMGVGWLVSQTALARFGGTLQIEARPQGGTLVRISLPVQEPDDEAVIDR